jgi:sec-independent protein translocase protein TatA
MFTYTVEPTEGIRRKRVFGFIGNIGPWELVLILLIALIVVGPGKLPEVARSIGKAMNEFKKVTTGVKREFQDVMRLEETEKKPSVKSQDNIEAKDERKPQSD